MNEQHGSLVKLMSGQDAYVTKIEKYSKSTTVTVRPLSRWWAIQVIQVLILRIKY